MKYLERIVSSYYLIFIGTLQVSASTRLAESTTPAFPLGGSEDKKSMTDRIDNHHSVAQLGYKEVGSFSWDAGKCDSAFVTVYVPLEGAILPNSKGFTCFVACVYEDIVVWAQLLKCATVQRGTEKRSASSVAMSCLSTSEPIVFQGLPFLLTYLDDS